MANTPKSKKRFLEDGISTQLPKRSRVELTLKQKYDLIVESEKVPKPTQKDLSLKFGIGKTTVSDILKQRWNTKITLKTMLLWIENNTLVVASSGTSMT